MDFYKSNFDVSPITEAVDVSLSTKSDGKPHRIHVHFSESGSGYLERKVIEEIEERGYVVGKVIAMDVNYTNVAHEDTVSIRKLFGACKLELVSSYAALAQCARSSNVDCPVVWIAINNQRAYYGDGNDAVKFLTGALSTNETYIAHIRAMQRLVMEGKSVPICFYVLTDECSVQHLLIKDYDVILAELVHKKEKYEGILKSMV